MREFQCENGQNLRLYIIRYKTTLHFSFALLAALKMVVIPKERIDCGNHPRFVPTLAIAFFRMNIFQKLKGSLKLPFIVRYSICDQQPESMAAPARSAIVLDATPRMFGRDRR